jgi:hypothetical protein
MRAFDTVKFEIDGETYYLNQSNCLGKKHQVKTDNYKCSLGLNFIEDEHNRVFNAVIKISIEKRKNPVLPKTPLDIIKNENMNLFLQLFMSSNKKIDSSIIRSVPSEGEDKMLFYQNQQKALIDALNG